MTHSAPDEQQLIEAARTRTEAGKRAYGELVELHQARLVRLMQHLLGRAGDAEDIAQEVFVRAYLALDRHPRGSPFWPWLRTIGTRLAYNHRRDEATRKRYETTAPPRTAKPDGLPARDLLEVVLSQLSYPYREILILRHVEELSTKEIAEQLRLGLSAAKMRLMRARAEFKERYDELSAG